MLFKSMRYATVLQPGQVWVSSNPRVQRRIIIDVFKGDVLYRQGSQAEGTPPASLARSQFRRWIAKQAATLAEHDLAAGQKVSPSAELGKRIQALRVAANLTQQQLADAIDISRSAVAFWETGREGSIDKHLMPLARVLGVTEDALLNGLVEEQIQTMLSPDERDLITLYRMLTPSRKLNAQKWLERQTNQSRSPEI